MHEMYGAIAFRNGGFKEGMSIGVEIVIKKMLTYHFKMTVLGFNADKVNMQVADSPCRDCTGNKPTTVAGSELNHSEGLFGGVDRFQQVNPLK